MRGLVAAVAATVAVLVLSAAGCSRSGFDAPILDGPVQLDAEVDQPGADAEVDGLPADLVLADWNLSLGQVAHYTMDTAPVAGVIKDLVGGHDAICGAGRCPTATPGKSGGALLFDGVDDHLQIGASGGAFEATSGFTVAVWLKPSSKTTALRCAVTKIHSGVTDNENSWGLFHQTKEKYGFESYDDLSGSFIYSPPGEVLIGAWQHVTISWDGKLKRLYLHGELVSAMKGSIKFSGAELLVGADLDFNKHLFHFAGAIDELRIYGRALDSAQIKVLASL